MINAKCYIKMAIMYTHILSSHSHFNILVIKEGEVAEVSHQNLNNTPGSFNLSVCCNCTVQKLGARHEDNKMQPQMSH